MPYALVVLIIKWYENTGMKCKWDVGVHHHWTWPIMEYFTVKGSSWRNGYKCPFNLRSSRWLASNSLYFDVRLTEFLIQWWKIFGYSQVLIKLVCESRWDWSLRIGRRYASVSLQEKKIFMMNLVMMKIFSSSIRIFTIKNYFHH